MVHLSFVILSVSLAVLYGLFLLFKRGRPALWVVALGGAFAATGLLEIFDYLSLARPEQLYLYKKWALIAESFLPLTWLLYSQKFARAGRSSWLQRIFLITAALVPLAAFMIPLEQFFYSPDFGEEMLLFLGDPGYFFYIAILLFLIFALVNLEVTLMSAPRTERWKIKFEVIGAGLIVAFFIVYYSQSLLYRSIDMSLAPARAMMFSIAVLLMAYSRIRRGDISGVRLSADMAYRSVVIFVLGLYFIGIALLGEGLRYFGESSQRTFFIVVAFVGCVAMIALLLSDKVKRKIKVNLHKHFYRSKYDYRQQWLDFTRGIAEARHSSELHGNILAFFCETFAVRGAVLFLRQDDASFRCVHEFEKRSAEEMLAPAVEALRKLDERDWVVDLEEESEGWGPVLAGKDAGFLVPLRSDNRIEGFVALGERINPSENLTYEDFDLMKVLARQAASAILNLRLSEELSAAREMELMGRVSAFVLHDLKNLTSNLGLVVDNAENYLDDPEFQTDMMETLRGTVGKMKGLIQRLKNLQEKSQLNRSPADLKQIATDGGRIASEKIDIEGEGVTADVDAEEIEKVVLNLVLNAREASNGKGRVRVEVGQEGGEGFIRVADQGSGMSEDFIRNRLFKPFETTKKKGFGIGLYQCRHIVEAHGGRIEVASEEGKGSTFTVWLPV